MKKRLVLVGGGHAHIEVLRSLAEHPGDFLTTLVTPYRRLLYSGMVPGLIAGHYGIAECAIDVEHLAARAGASVSFTTATLIDAKARSVMGSNAIDFPYDVLSLDAGSASPIEGIAGAEAHAVPVRPLESLVAGWTAVLERAREGRVGAVTLVGAGAAGVELALAMAYRFRRELGERAPHVRLLGDTPRIAPELARGARARLARWLERRQVGVHLGSRVTRVGETSLQTEHGIEFASDAVFWSAGGAAHSWIREAEFRVDERGFLAVDDCLQSESHLGVFGAGDCVTHVGRPYPKAGVFAVAAAPVLAANLRAALAGTALTPFKRSRRYLALVSTGGRYAVGAWNGFAWSGGWAWRTKDRIDREFVARYAA